MKCQCHSWWDCPRRGCIDAARERYADSIDKLAPWERAANEGRRDTDAPIIAGWGFK